MDSNDEYKSFLDHHELQLVLSGIPSHFWPKLYKKLKSETFDAGGYFSMLCTLDDDDDTLKRNEFVNEQLEDSNRVGHEKPMSNSLNISMLSRWKVVVSKEDGISKSDPDCIFLVDHAWTFKWDEARKHLIEVPGLLQRMCQLIDIELEGEKTENLIEDVLERIWLFCQTYSVQRDDLSVEEQMPVWYVLDEFGSRIRHSDQSNFRLVPFYYVAEQTLYSLLFPKVDVPCGAEVTRDFVEGSSYHHPDWRRFYLIPWFPYDATKEDYKFLIPTDEFFNSSRENEILPTDSPTWPKSTNNRRLKVYSEYDKIKKFLSHPSFVVVDSAEEADVLWLYKHFKEYKQLIETKPNVFINQFPYESVLTVKDLLAACIHLAYGNSSPFNGHSDESNLQFDPPWFPVTFNLRFELPRFVSYFQRREALELDNTWIIKPWNLARGLDTYVTNNLNQIIRLIDTGPKIACKYLEDPVLFYRADINAWVKFDMRFIVLLRSVNPLKVYVYDRFWLRFALKEFSLDHFDDYEKHFTVFNYVDKSKILQMYSKDFVEQFTDQYPTQNWTDVLKSIHESIKETFASACKQPPPKGLAPYAQCRAMYGVDMMIKWGENKNGNKIMQPVMLEVNFTPDCARACDYYPDFMNTVFETLFLDSVNETLPVTLL